MPVKVWKTKTKWCARWGSSGKMYCGASKVKVVNLAKKQAKAIYAAGYKKKG